jgi:hypothetical protein
MRSFWIQTVGQESQVAHFSPSLSSSNNCQCTVYKEMLGEFHHPVTDATSFFPRCPFFLPLLFLSSPFFYSYHVLSLKMSWTENFVVSKDVSAKGRGGGGGRGSVGGISDVSTCTDSKLNSSNSSFVHRTGRLQLKRKPSWPFISSGSSSPSPSSS